MVFCWEPWLCISMNLFDFWEPWLCISMNLFDFLRTTCQVCAVHSWFFPSQMLCSCFVSNAFCQSFLCQCSNAIYGFTTKSSSPIMIPIACLLASFLPSFLIHTLGCFLFLPPFVSEWSVKSFHYVCMVTMAPTLMRSSPRVFHYVTLISMPPRPHHSFLTWVVLSSRFCFFSPKKVRRNQREWIGLPPNSKL